MAGRGCGALWDGHRQPLLLGIISISILTITFMASIAGGDLLNSVGVTKTDKPDAFNQLEHGKPSALTINDALNLLSLPRFWALILFVVGTCIYSVYTINSSRFSSLHNLHHYSKVMRCTGILIPYRFS